MSAKPWWESRTAWVNIISTAVGIVSLFVEPGVLVGLGLAPDLAANYQAKLLIGLAVLNILLRAVTRQPVAMGRRR